VKKGTNRQEVRMADKGTVVKGNGKKSVTGKRSDKQLGRQAMDERQRESERRGPGDKDCDRKGE
jgi:hypothetical protein